MRKIKSLAFMVVIMMTTMFSLTSCDKDNMTAMELDGIWRGTVASDYFSYRGMATRYQTVEIEFNNNIFANARGTGVEYDYDSYSGSYRSYFSFEVRNGNIYLDYDDGSHVAIYNYSLNYGYFSGEFHDYYTGKYLASFRFTKINDWSYYSKPGYKLETYEEAKKNTIDLSE